MKIEPAGHRVIVRPDPLSEVEQRELQQYESLKSKGFEVADPDRKRKEQTVIIGTVVAVGAQAWIAHALSIINNRKELFEAGFSAEVIAAACKPWAKVGDRVYFAKYGGYVIEEDGIQYRMLNDEDITGIVLGEAA